jgi:deoxyribodipyrimidine photo-lyase
VWLVLPWALRAPDVQAQAPEGTVCIGLYLQEHHAVWPWPEARWRWVDTAMAAVTTERWHVTAEDLARTLAGAASVRGAADPHIAHHLQGLARLDPAPALFPRVERRCSSFSQWWTRATRGLQQAQELL